MTTTTIAESVGELLRHAREERGVTREALASRTKIPERYVAFFEDGAHDRVADDVYTKIYLKAYAKFVGFDSEALVELFRKERERIAGAARRPIRPAHPTPGVATGDLVVTPKLIHAALLGLLVVAFAGYFVVELAKIFTPPSIALASPQDGLVTADASVAVEGKTEPEVTLHINGKEVSPDGNGDFKDTIELQTGLNLITVSGAKKHGKEMTVTRRVIVQPPPTTPVDNAIPQ